MFQRTRNKGVIFYSIHDYLVYFTIYCSQARQRGVSVLSLCPMPDHTHQVIVAASKNQMATFVQTYSHLFAYEWNKKRKKKGFLFSHPFGSAAKLGNKQVRTVLAYSNNNPVERKLVERAEDYRWTFLAYAKSKHPFSEPLVHKDASRAFRRIIKMVDYYSKAGVPLEYNWLGRWFSELDGVERQQLIDYIIVSYNCIDYEKLFSYYDNSYDTACLAFASNQGSEYDIKEDFVPGSHIPYLEIPIALKKYHGIDNPKTALWLPDDQRANLLCDLAMETHASIRQLKKYLRLTGGE